MKNRTLENCKNIPKNFSQISLHKFYLKKYQLEKCLYKNCQIKFYNYS